MKHAQGTFEVTMTPQADSAEEAMGRLLISKVFHGDLQGVSSGQMLSVGTATQGSAGYVALESVQATLQGQEGGFALQHSGTLNRGAPTLSVTVVPDSGTGQLIGLTGSMTLDRTDGQHSYVLSYELLNQEERAQE